MTHIEILKAETSPTQVMRYRKRLEDDVRIIDSIFKAMMDLTRQFRRVDDRPAKEAR